MKKVVFCEIAWMKEYCGVTEDDKPMNGGSYIDENGEGGEVFNFLPYNHNCYGYVRHQGNELHIERYDKVASNHSEVSGMTVVWVASDGKSSKIVGWYENATMYREWQSFRDLYGEKKVHDYNFKAKETDCYLIPEDKREFAIPRASIVGKGRGMGQSQIWYADSGYAQEEIVPEVLSYLESIRGECLVTYLSKEEMEAKAEDTGQTLEQIEKEIQELLTLRDVVALANLAVAKEDTFESRFFRAEVFRELLFYDEAEEDYKTALFYKEDLNCMVQYMDLEIMLEHNFLVIELGEKIRARRDEVEGWNIIVSHLIYTYIDEGELDIAQEILVECEREKDKYNHDFIESAWEWIDEIRKDMHQIVNE